MYPLHSAQPTTLTLECLLNDTTSASFQAFSVYLQRQYATENLVFWLAVERYRNDYTTAMTNDTKHTVKIMAERFMNIVHTHVQFNACQEINIPCDMRHAILDKVFVGDECDYHPDLFIPASEAVLELMRSNSFIPWLGEWNPALFTHQRTSSLPSSLSSPDGWNIISSNASRLSISSFRSTNDTILPSTPSPPRVGGLSYQTMLKRMKERFFFRTHNPTRRSSLTWPATSHRKS